MILSEIVFPEKLSIFNTTKSNKLSDCFFQPEIIIELSFKETIDYKISLLSSGFSNE